MSEHGLERESVGSEAVSSTTDVPAPSDSSSSSSSSSSSELPTDRKRLRRRWGELAVTTSAAPSVGASAAPPQTAAETTDAPSLPGTTVPVAVSVAAFPATLPTPTAVAAPVITQLPPQLHGIPGVDVTVLRRPPTRVLVLCNIMHDADLEDPSRFDDVVDDLVSEVESLLRDTTLPSAMPGGPSVVRKGFGGELLSWKAPRPSDRKTLPPASADDTFDREWRKKRRRMARAEARAASGGAGTGGATGSSALPASLGSRSLSGAALGGGASGGGLLEGMGGPLMLRNVAEADLRTTPSGRTVADATEEEEDELLEEDPRARADAETLEAFQGKTLVESMTGKPFRPKPWRFARVAGLGRLFLEFDSVEVACLVQQAIGGRWFNQKILVTTFHDEEAYQANQFWGYGSPASGKETGGAATAADDKVAATPAGLILRLTG